MAKKFKIAQNPTFKADVKIPRIGGAYDVVGFEYKFIPRKELAGLYDSWRDKASTLEINEDSKLIDLTEFEVDLQTQQIMDIVIGWAFEDVFNEDNVRMLVESCAAAPSAIIDGFQSAYVKAKEGN